MWQRVCVLNTRRVRMPREASAARCGYWGRGYQPRTHFRSTPLRETFDPGAAITGATAPKPVRHGARAAELNTGCTSVLGLDG